MDDRTQAWLADLLHTEGARAGSVHVVRDGDLHLQAAVALPPPVIDLVRFVPRGKGMAGLALERQEPVQTCNLKTDASGDVKPGARLVDARAAIALPVSGPDGQVFAVLGVAYDHEGEVSPATVEHLLHRAASLPR